ncbi:hypothetical protein [Streptomyces cacaoi]|uniref:hypothetical protein n=1 Tax=Streptomyces cacaoi TaxID=1898 RepID=UPI0011F114C5|nr:hypothetical protein [Streptomyces cacaoi]
MYTLPIPGTFAARLRSCVIIGQAPMSERLRYALARGSVRRRGLAHFVLAVLSVPDLRELLGLCREPSPLGELTDVEQRGARQTAQRAADLLRHDREMRRETALLDGRIRERRCAVARQRPAAGYRDRFGAALRGCSAAEWESDLVTGETATVLLSDLWGLLSSGSEGSCRPRVVDYVRAVIDLGCDDPSSLWSGGPRTADTVALLVEPPRFGSRNLLAVPRAKHPEC